MPGIVIKSDIIQSGTHRAFEQYINYINRDEKLEDIKYTGYFDYVDRDRTAFTAEANVVDEEGIQFIKRIYQEAQANGSNLWRSFISFNHDYLEQCGILQNNRVDDVALQSMTKKYMASIIESEGITNAYWVGAIHYDTDNIHVHTSLIQTVPDREKGKFLKQSLEKAKSAAVLSIDQSHQKDTIALNDLLRNRIIDKQISKSIETASELAKSYDQIFESLPEDRRLWKYNLNALQEVRPEINQFIDQYLERMKPEELKQFNELIEKIEERSRFVYGDTEKSYAENKRQDLYSRMGNALLKDMLAYSKELELIPNESILGKTKVAKGKVEMLGGISIEQDDDEWLPTPTTVRRDDPEYSSIKSSLEYPKIHPEHKQDVFFEKKNQRRPPRKTITQYRRMHHYLNDEWEHYKNKLVYDQLQKNIEIEES